MGGVLNDDGRLGALRRYDILDTPQEETFDRVTRLARHLMNTSMATITFVDGHRQWFKSRQGLGVPETKRDAFCSFVVSEGEPLVISDAVADERFAASPYVTGAPGIRAYAGVPLRTPDGHTLGTLCVMDTEPKPFTDERISDLSDLAGIVMNELELRVRATTDSLTGALSRMGFREAAERAISLAIRHRHGLGLLVLDLDHFKAVNDTYGHPTGDVVLVETVAICKEVLRKSDIIGRLGGEEFGVLLPHTAAASVFEVAEKLRTALARAPHQALPGPFSVTASIGVASLERSAADLDTLLARADAALYEAKQEGRNRAVVWKAPPDPELLGKRRVFKAGRISFNSGRSTIDCTVRTLSESGAGVDVVSSAGVPGEFKLQIEADHFSQLCRVTQKTDKHMELEFA